MAGDTHSVSHVGVSAGPSPQQVLDLAQVQPGLDSVAELWRQKGGGQGLRDWLSESLARTPVRQALEPRQLRIPVELAECWAAGVTYEMSRDARITESQNPRAGRTFIARYIKPSVRNSSLRPRGAGWWDHMQRSACGQTLTGKSPSPN